MVKAFVPQHVEQRPARLSTPVRDDDWAWRVVWNSSTAAARMERWGGRIRTPVVRSHAAAAITSLRAKWLRLHWSNQRRLSGTTLVVAPIAHLSLTLWDATPPGWLWLVVPALTVTIGGLLLAAATPQREPE